MTTQNDSNSQKKEETELPGAFVGELFRKDVETTGGDSIDPPILDMPGESGMLTEEERGGLLQSGPPPKAKPKPTEPPILSLDFFDLKSEEEK